MSSHVFSLLFKVLLNSTLSWWKTICFVGLVLLELNAGLGKHQSLCRGASGTRSSWGGRKRDWGTQQAVGFPLLGNVISPAEWRNPWLAGRCWGRGVTGLALHQLHKHPVDKWVCISQVFWDLVHPHPHLLCLSPTPFGLFFPTSCFLSLFSNWSTFLLSSYFLCSLSSVILSTL